MTYFLDLTFSDVDWLELGSTRVLGRSPSLRAPAAHGVSSNAPVTIDWPNEERSTNLTSGINGKFSQDPPKICRRGGVNFWVVIFKEMSCFFLILAAVVKASDEKVFFSKNVKSLPKNLPPLNLKGFPSKP